MKDSFKSCRPILRRLCWSVLSLYLALLSATQVTAEGYELVTTADHRIGALELEASAGKLELNLEEALSIALERNLSLVVQRYEYSRSLQGVLQNLGIYDFDLTSSLSTSSNTRPQTSNLVETGDDAALTTDSDSFASTISRLTPIGGTASFTFSADRTETNNAQEFINPSFLSSAGLRYTQPLLRDLGRLATERNLIVARTTSKISREQLQLQVEQVMQQVSDSYWRLVEAREQLTVAEESLKLAEELHDMNRIQVEVGTMAPLEMVRSEAGVATRQEEIIRRQAAVHDSEDRIRQLLNFDSGVLWDVEILPTTDPETPFEPIDVKAAVKTAFEARPDLRRKKLENRNLEVDARYSLNQIRPGLELEARYGFNGVGGDLRTVDPETGLPVVIPGGLSDSISQVTDGLFEGWSVGLNFAYPLQNRVAKAQRAVADLAVEQGALELRELEQQVLTEVRLAARAVETAAKQIESAKISSRLEEENLKAERKRYENGISTSFEILETQEDLSAARSREVSAIVSYRIALVEFHRAIGRLLDEMQVELQSADGEE